MTAKQIRALGAVFWITVVVGSAGWLIASSRGGAAPLLSAVWTPTRSIELIDETSQLRVGDAAFAVGAGDNEWAQVGHVERVDSASQIVTLTLYDQGNMTAPFDATLHRSSGKLDDVLATLLPKQKREEVGDRIANAMRTHGQEISNAMLPLVFESFRQSLPVIESELKASLKRHESEFDSMLARFRTEIIQEQMVPLVRTEVIPVLKEHGREPAELIGQEIWNRASLWRFGWRALYDKSPLPERELVQEEWSRFVENEVVPIVESHLDEIAAAVEAIITDLAGNKNLRDQLGAVAGQILDDAQARQLLREILVESVVENQRLRDVWVSVWTSPEAREKLRLAGERLEPILREIGDEVLGTQTDGIEPGFARVLRNQILGKDRRWITLLPRGELGSDGSAPVRLRVASEFSPYPVVHLAAPEK